MDNVLGSQLATEAFAPESQTERLRSPIKARLSRLRPAPRIWWVCGIVGLALVLRVWAVLTLPAEARVPRYDAAQYDRLAMSLGEGIGFAWPEGGMQGYYPLPAGPTSYRAPGYPVFLAAIYRLWGHDYTAVRLVQSVVGALLCGVVYGLGLWWGGPAVGTLSAVLTAVYPPFIRFSYYGGPGLLLSEGLFMFVLAIAVWWLVRLTRDGRRFTSAVMAGVLLGVATLTRPVTLLFPAVLLVWAWWAPRPERWPLMRATAIVCMAYGLTLLPWVIRNYRAHHRFVPVTSVTGKAFWVGNNAWARGGAVESNVLYDPATFDPGYQLSEMERSDRMLREGLRFWQEHPEKLPKLFFRKLLMLWNVYDLRYNLAYGLLVPWALMGLAVTWRSPTAQISRLFVGLLLYQSLMSMVLFGSTRYRYPFEPYLILFAAAGLVWWFGRAIPKWIPATVLAGMVAINVVLYQQSDRVLQVLRDTFQLLGLR